MNLEKYIESKLSYQNNYDVVKRKVSDDFVLYYLSSLVDMTLVNELIEGNILKRNEILNGSISQTEQLENAISAILSGCVLLILKNQLFIVETRNYPNRGISESESEKSLKGSHDGFGESILINTALIRRRIKDEKFRCELFQIGKRSKCDVTINYINGLVNPTLLLKIKKKLNSIDISSLVLADKALAELLFDQKFQIFPKVRYSERPDIASIHILKGYIVILVDTSSSCIIVPTTFFELNEQLEEYHLPPVISTLNRIFRFFCVIIGLYLLPYWFICCLNHYAPNRSFMIIDNLSPTQLFVQILSVLIFLSAIRLASFNTTSLLSTSMSLLATIVLSSLAIETGLLSPQVVFYCALTSICSFAISNYETSRAITFWSFIFILAIGFFNTIGFIIANCLMFLSVVCIHHYDVYYLYPFIPFDIKKLFYRFFRIQIRSKKNKKY